MKVRLTTRRHSFSVENYPKVITFSAMLLVATLSLSPTLFAQESSPAAPQSVLPVNALLTTPIGNLPATNATSSVVAVHGEPFSQALHVTIGLDSKETNATQLTMLITSPVNKGDVLIASFYVRGKSASGNGGAQAAFLFEQSVSPWNKSTTDGVSSSKNPNSWTRYSIPFMAVQNYSPGDAMVSLRFAFGPQTVEVGGLSVLNYGTSKTLNDLVTAAAVANPLGQASVAINLSDKRQSLIGLGGDFCQARYGETEMIDPVGEYTLSNLHVAQARIGVPLNDWTPEKGVYKDDSQSHAAFLLMQLMARKKIPVIATVWEGPAWLLPGQPEQSGRTLAPEEYHDCIEAIAQFLVTARDKYGAEPDYFSFNEPDYGVNFLFTPAQMANFIRQAGPRFQALGLNTKFLVGDTTGGIPIVSYAEPLLQDRSIAPYLGPVSFHCWDCLTASDQDYAKIAELGRTYHKTVLCTEAGHDSGLWEAPDPWGTWENALRTAEAYAKTLRLTGASVMDYWTYENNYPLVSKDGAMPYPVFSVIKQMENALPVSSRVVADDTSRDELGVVATAGPKHGQFSALLVNSIGAGTVILTGLPPNEKVSVFESDADTQNRAVGAGRHVDAAGKLTVSIGFRSVVTVISR